MFPSNHNTSITRGLHSHYEPYSPCQQLGQPESKGPDDYEPRLLPLTSDIIDPHRLIEEIAKLAEHLSTEGSFAHIAKHGSIPLINMIGNGDPQYDAKYIESWKSIKYWIGAHSTCPWLEHGNEHLQPAAVGAKELSEIVQWLGTSMYTYQRFTELYPDCLVERWTVGNRSVLRMYPRMDMLRVDGKSSFALLCFLRLTSLSQPIAPLNLKDRAGSVPCSKLGKFVVESVLLYTNIVWL